MATGAVNYWNVNSFDVYITELHIIFKNCCTQLSQFKQVNITAADAMAPCISRSSVAMI